MTQGLITGGPYQGTEGEIKATEAPSFLQVGTRTVHKDLVQVLPDQISGARADLMIVDDPIKASDLKPRGVKRQWWLVPLDALSRTYDPECGAEHIVEALAMYQDTPCAQTAAVCFNTFLHDWGEAQNKAMDTIVQVFEHGAAKYSPDNWRRAAEDMDVFRREYLSAMCRHVFPADSSPIDLDHTLPNGTEVKGSGFPHWAHACCTALMVLWQEMEHE